MESRAISHVISCTTAGTCNLYTCPVNCRAKIPLVFISNANGNNTVSLRWYRKQDNASYYILGSKNMSLGDYVQFTDTYIVLEPEDRLDITISSAGIVDAFCTTLEEFISTTNRKNV